MIKANYNRNIYKNYKYKKYTYAQNKRRETR